MITYITYPNAADIHMLTRLANPSSSLQKFTNTKSHSRIGITSRIYN